MSFSHRRMSRVLYGPEGARAGTAPNSPGATVPSVARGAGDSDHSPLRTNSPRSHSLFNAISPTPRSDRWASVDGDFQHTMSAMRDFCEQRRLAKQRADHDLRQLLRELPLERALSPADREQIGKLIERFMFVAVGALSRPVCQAFVEELQELRARTLSPLVTRLLFCISPVLRRTLTDSELTLQPMAQTVQVMHERQEHSFLGEIRSAKNHHDAEWSTVRRRRGSQTVLQHGGAGGADGSDDERDGVPAFSHRRSDDALLPPLPLFSPNNAASPAASAAGVSGTGSEPLICRVCEEPVAAAEMEEHMIVCMLDMMVIVNVRRLRRVIRLLDRQISRGQRAFAANGSLAAGEGEQLRACMPLLTRRAECCASALEMLERAEAVAPTGRADGGEAFALVQSELAMLEQLQAQRIPDSLMRLVIESTEAATEGAQLAEIAGQFVDVFQEAARSMSLGRRCLSENDLHQGEPGQQQLQQPETGDGQAADWSQCGSAWSRAAAQPSASAERSIFSASALPDPTQPPGSGLSELAVHSGPLFTQVAGISSAFAASAASKPLSRSRAPSGLRLVTRQLSDSPVHSPGGSDRPLPVPRNPSPLASAVSSRRGSDMELLPAAPAHSRTDSPARSDESSPALGPSGGGAPALPAAAGPRVTKRLSLTNLPRRPSERRETRANVSISIDSFEMIKPISRGAFGRVFLAMKRKTGDLYAVKVLSKADTLRKNQLANVTAEQSILASANNPFVVKLFYSFASKRFLYLVMEFVNGGDLYSLLQSVGRLEEGSARAYVAELCLALEYLHDELGVVHRDLKPDNALIDSAGHIVLTDFGLSHMGVGDVLSAPAREREGERRAADEQRKTQDPYSSEPSRPTSVAAPTREPSVELITPAAAPAAASAEAEPVSAPAAAEGGPGGAGAAAGTGIGCCASQCSSPRPVAEDCARPASSAGQTSGQAASRASSEAQPAIGERVRRDSPDGPQLLGLQAGARVGTPDYMSPEILLGTGHDARVDWWSLGVVLFELIVGMTPFSAPSAQTVFANILSGNVQWPADKEQHFSPEVIDLVARLLTLDPAQRLGANGAAEVKQHPFFKGVDWDSLRRRERSHAPFVPQLDDIFDTSYFKERMRKQASGGPHDGAHDGGQSQADFVLRSEAAATRPSPAQPAAQPAAQPVDAKQPGEPRRRARPSNVGAGEEQERLECQRPSECAAPADGEQSAHRELPDEMPGHLAMRQALERQSSRGIEPADSDSSSLDSDDSASACALTASGARALGAALPEGDVAFSDFSTFVHLGNLQQMTRLKLSELKTKFGEVSPRDWASECSSVPHSTSTSPVSQRYYTASGNASKSGSGSPSAVRFTRAPPSNATARAGNEREQQPLMDGLSLNLALPESIQRASGDGRRPSPMVLPARRV